MHQSTRFAQDRTRRFHPLRSDEDRVYLSRASTVLGAHTPPWGGSGGTRKLGPQGLGSFRSVSIEALLGRTAAKEFSLLPPFRVFPHCTIFLRSRDPAGRSPGGVAAEATAPFLSPSPAALYCPVWFGEPRQQMLQLPRPPLKTASPLKQTRAWLSQFRETGSQAPHFVSV